MLKILDDFWKKIFLFWN